MKVSIILGGHGVHVTRLAIDNVNVRISATILIVHLNLAGLVRGVQGGSCQRHAPYEWDQVADCNWNDRSSNGRANRDKTVGGRSSSADYDYDEKPAGEIE